MKYKLMIAAAMLVSVSYGQVRDFKSLTLESAEKILREAKKIATQLNAPHGGPAIAVVDRAGNLLLLQRPETTFGGSALVAFEKAFTAVNFEQPTKNFENKIKEGRTPLITVGYVMLEGGVPITYNGEVIGAVGISGAASSQQDVEIAEAAAKAKID
jgi:glc operon protein GlcG